MTHKNVHITTPSTHTQAHHMYTSMHLCMSHITHHTHTRARTHAHTHTHSHMHIHTRILTHTYARMHVHSHTHTHAVKHACILTHTYARMHTHTHMHTCMYTHIHTLSHYLYMNFQTAFQGVDVFKDIADNTRDNPLHIRTIQYSLCQQHKIP